MAETVRSTTISQPDLHDPGAGTSLKVLLIGGTREEARRLEDRLAHARRIRVQPVHVERTVDAISCLSRTRFDAVLVDLTTVPSDTVPRLAARAPGLPLIVLVGQDDDRQGVAALGAGAQDYLIKADIHNDALERSILYSMERKRSEATRNVEPAEWSYEQLVDSLDCIVWEGDAQTFQFTFVSKQAERILGFPVERWTSEPAFWQDHIHPDDRAWAPAFCAVATREKRTHDFEYRMLAADGHIVWLRDIVAVVVANDQPVKLRGVMVDITEQKRIEQDLRASEAQYRAIFEATTDGLTINTLEGALVEVNPAFAAMHGYTCDEMAGMDPRTFIHPDYHVQTPQAFRAFAAGRDYTEVFAQDVRKDGTVFPVEVHGIRFIYRGEPHILCIVRDITERVLADEQRRISEQQYRAVFEATSDGLIIADLEGRVIEVNPALADMHGYTRAEFVGLSRDKFVHPSSWPLQEEYLRKVRAGERFHTEGMDVRKDGTAFHVDVREVPFMHRGEPHNLVIMRDITERVKTEERLRLQEEQYRAIFEAVTDGLVICDLDGTVLEVNPAFAALLGYTREDLIGMDPRNWVHPDSHANVAAFLHKAAAGERYYTEGRQVRKDGSVFPAEVYGTPFLYNGRRHALAIIHDITERAHAHKLLEQRVAERTRELATLLEVANNVTSTLELQPLLSKVLEQLKAVADYKRARITLMHGGRRIAASAWVDYPPGQAPDEPGIHVDKLGVVGEMLSRGETLIIPDIQAGDRIAATMRGVITGAMTSGDVYTGESLETKLGMERSQLLVPIVLKETVVGGLTLRHSAPGYYTPEHAKLATAIVSQAAIAIENAQLYEQAQENTRKTAALAQAAAQVAFGGSLQSTLGVLCQRVVEVTQAVAAAVVLHDPATKQDYIAGSYGLPDGYPAAVNKLVAAAGNMPMMGDAVAGHRATLAHNMRRTFLDSPAFAPLHPFVEQVSWDTLVGVPLKYRDEHVGALLSYHLPTTNIGDVEIGLHCVIADQAAVAVGNARLLAQAQENTRKTAALAQVASQVAFGGSLQSTLDVLCQRVVEVTGSLASAVVLRDEAQLRMVGTSGLPDGYAAAMNRILAAGTQLITQPAFSGQRPVSTANMRKALLANPAYAPIHGFVAEAQWDTVVAVPMIYRDRAVGVLLSYHPPTHSIDGTEMTFHSVIADQAAVAVENARLLVEAHDKARLEERQRLARELHDSVTQALFSISLIARSAEILLKREGTHAEETMEKLADLRQLTAGALAEMRALIFELRPGALEEEGLLEALRKHAAAVQGREMLQVDVSAPGPGELPRLKPAAEEALYRITQEALHNVVKHARATRVEVWIQARDGFVVVQVGDDGIGFDAGQVPAGHMGLGTMRQRAQALGGEYQIASRPGEGTTVTVRVPLAEWQL